MKTSGIFRTKVTAESIKNKPAINLSFEYHDSSNKNLKCDACRDLIPKYEGITVQGSGTMAFVSALHRKVDLDKKESKIGFRILKSLQSAVGIDTENRLVSFNHYGTDNVSVVNAKKGVVAFELDSKAKCFANLDTKCGIATLERFTTQNAGAMEAFRDQSELVEAIKEVEAQTEQKSNK